MTISCTLTDRFVGVQKAMRIFRSKKKASGANTVSIFGIFSIIIVFMDIVGAPTSWASSDLECEVGKKKGVQNFWLFKPTVSEEYERARENGTVECYEKLLALFPDDEYVKTIVSDIKSGEMVHVIYPAAVSGNFISSHAMYMHGGGIFLIKDGSPFIKSMPNIVGHKPFLKSQPTPKEILKIGVRQRLSTTKQAGNQKIGRGGETFLIVDNATSNEFEVKISADNGGIAASARLKPHTYLQFDAGTGITRKIVTVLIYHPNGDLYEKKKFFYPRGGPGYRPYMIYNVGSANNYELIKKYYTKQ
jgi:hypothetical protein